ncbi:MAG: hypothetical protein D6725_12750 [Planctomycetota bacterium]|nr:MAG: hypothetical protein D6725_12750 [Planctomycetota bacterium]
MFGHGNRPKPEPVQRSSRPNDAVYVGVVRLAVYQDDGFGVRMKRIRRLFRWCVWCSVVLVCAAVWYGYRQWEARNALIRQAVLQYAARQWPQLRVSIDACRMDLLHGIRLIGVRADFAADGRPLAHVPQIIVDVDSVKYLRTRQLQIDRLRIDRPHLYLRRDSEGRWSVEDLLTRPPTGMSVPEIEVVGGTIVVQLLQASRPVTLSARVDRLTISVSPSSGKMRRPPLRCRFEGEVPPFGPLKATFARWPDMHRSSISGTLTQLRVDRRLLRFLVELSPEFAERVARLRKRVEAQLSQPQDDRHPFPLRLFLPRQAAQASWIHLDENGNHGAAVVDSEDFTAATSSGRNPRVPRGAVDALPRNPAAVAADDLPEPYGIRPEHDPLVRLGFESAETHETLSNPPSPEARRSGARSVSSPTSEAVPANGRRRLAGTGDPARPEVWNYALLDLDVVGALTFSFAQWEAARPWDFRLAYRVDAGRLYSALLPFELEDFSGVITADPQSVRVERLRCGRGPTRITIDAHVALSGAAGADRVALSVADLPVDERLRRHLSPGLARLAELYQPSGPCDISMELAPGNDGRWHLNALRLTAKGCRVSYRDCPYPIHDLHGSIELKGEVFEIAMRGRAGQRPVFIAGLLKKAPPPAPFVLDVKADRLPIDDTARSVVPEAVRNVADMLRLRGELDIHVRVARGEHAQRAEMEIAAAINEGVIEYEGFPYRIDSLRGQIVYRSGTWTFQKLAGRHGTAELLGDAVFIQSSPTHPAELTLHVETKAAALDESLQLALTPGLRSLWDDLKLSGRVNVTTDVHWVRGKPLEVSLPLVEWYDGSMTPRWLPYSLRGAVGRFQYADGRLTVNRLLARHDETTLDVKGFAQIEPGLWTLRLESVQLARLRADQELLRALERGGLDGLHFVFSCLSPETPITLRGLIELKGTGREDDPVTAAWDVNAFLGGATIEAGLEYTGVDGRVTSRGIYDGQQATVAGRLELQRLTVLGYQLEEVSGPYHIAGDEFVLGSTQAFVAEAEGQAGPVDVNKRVTAEFIGGVIALDARSTLEAVPEYELHLDLSYGKLEEYARRYMRGARNLKGVMNGWVDLAGRGSSLKALRGRGQLQISPAALYELPVIMQVFRVLSLNPPERSAFNYALFDFYVRDGAVRFNSIDLVGNSVSLHSRGGVVYLDGRIDLEFYSMLPRGQVPIPALDVLLKQTTTGWVGVEVKGTLDRPRASVKPAPLLDDALKRFLNAFELRPPRYPVRRQGRGYSVYPRGGIRR